MTAFRPAPSLAAPPGPVGSDRRSLPARFAYVGTGGRVRMFLDPVAGRFRAEAAIVGLCDSSLVRAGFHRDRLKAKFGYADVPAYAAADFGRMLRETRPDTVVVCTVDSEHHRYIVEALRAGCDVVTEKPMTTDAAKCRQILDAVQATGRTVRVAFNYRWNPGVTKVRELIAAGTIGQVRHVTLEYLLNTSHGADYFRRWHAQKRFSGGLLVHKATHHFDLVNWWIDAIPADVFAQGGLMFYGRANAERRGDHALAAYPRYYPQARRDDPFAYTYEQSMIQDTSMERGLYLGAAEQESGYVRDRNVFRDDIDIEDTMNVLVRYRTGALLSYSLNAYSPYEGYRVAFTGDRGRIEYREFHAAHLFDPAGGTSLTKRQEEVHELQVFPHFKAPYAVPVPVIHGDHGGSDPLLQEQIFAARPPADPFGRSAGHEQGAASILVGIAANASIASGAPVALDSLLVLKPSARQLSELV
ncbi:MAG TPA: Gfo/Idh/MocA family oxidoreductase [Opitutaceae bacterium]|nr:Gfo/Idh/MocA family oxidoreductase [Opitutaceae bacterium]